jgi:hypothetical protein
MSDDSIKGIYKTLEDCALISQYGGGIGVHAHNIRAAGSLIRGTGGTSNGILPMLRVFNNTARYVDQCFTGSTLIFTSKGPKPIHAVEAGDMVMTSGSSEIVDVDGKHAMGRITPTYRKVIRRVEHAYSGPILHVTARLSDVDTRIIVTPDHPFLSVTAEDAVKFAIGLVRADYYPLRILKPGDTIINTGYAERSTIIRMEEDVFEGFPRVIARDDHFSDCCECLCGEQGEVFIGFHHWVVERAATSNLSLGPLNVPAITAILVGLVRKRLIILTCS